MYRVLIVDDDKLMRETLEILICRNEGFQVSGMAETGEQAVKCCEEDPPNLVFMDILMPGMTGLEASKSIHQSHPEIAIYILSAYSSMIPLKEGFGECVREVMEKPLSPQRIRKILDNYRTANEGSVRYQLEALTSILQRKNFDEMYQNVKQIVDEVYEIVGEDPMRLSKIFTFLGQSLLNTISFYSTENLDVSELFPLNEGLILERKTSELWLFRIMDYLFQRTSVNRYPLLDKVFSYIENNIKEDINLNRIIENCAISQGYLSRIFKEQFGVSVMEYLHMRKIHLAKGYFYFTRDSVAEIAFRLGYNESSYFSKVFKKYERMTVKEYRSLSHT